MVIGKARIYFVTLEKELTETQPISQGEI